MLNFQDSNAFRLFISEHQSRVYNVVLNMVQDERDAEEITQDVFVDVHRKPEAFRGESAVSTWLYRIATNKCIDHLRKKQRRIGFFSMKGDEEDRQKDFYHPGVAAENKDKAAMLFKAMKQLPANQHTAWVLSEMENLSYKEISEVMRLSVSSVESLLVRARKNLRNYLTAIAPAHFKK